MYIFIFHFLFIVILSFTNGANERGRAKGNSAFGYEGISDLDKEFERRADSLEQQINKDHRLNRERERAIQEQRENKRREEQGTKRENTRSLQDDDKEIRGIERASSREVRKGFEGSRNIKKYHMEMMRVLSQTVAQVERIDKLNWKDRVKQYAIQMGITLGAILIILGAYQLINLIK